MFLLLAVLAAAALALCACAETLRNSASPPGGLARNYGRVLGTRFVSLGLAFSLVFAAQGFLIGARPTSSRTCWA